MKLKCDPQHLRKVLRNQPSRERYDAAVAHALLKALEHVHEPMRGMVLEVAAEILRDEFGVTP